jgi:hypothetical protein
MLRLIARQRGSTWDRERIVVLDCLERSVGSIYVLQGFSSAAERKMDVKAVVGS